MCFGSEVYFCFSEGPPDIVRGKPASIGRHARRPFVVLPLFIDDDPGRTCRRLWWRDTSSGRSRGLETRRIRSERG